MNINQLINDKKDKLATSGKPLNAGAGPDLIEVLATRKLLEEKEAAARELALKQQQTAGTIAEQQEQKLLGLTQKEIANQTGGILAQRAQQQQQQQKKPPQQGGIMGQPPRPPMGQPARPPMGQPPRPPMGGMPSAMGSAPRPRMARGGIVGYNQGGDVSAVVAAVKKRIQALDAVADKGSPEYQQGLQKIQQTLGTQSNPQEKAAIEKVLTDAGMMTGAAKAKYDVNRARGSQFGGGIGSPRFGEQVQRQVDERGAMAIVDQAMSLSGAQGLKTIIAGAGKKYGPQVVNLAKDKLASLGNQGRKLFTKPKYTRPPNAKMGRTSTGRMTKKGGPDEARVFSPQRVSETAGIGSLAYLGLDAMAGGDDAAATQAPEQKTATPVVKPKEDIIPPINTRTKTETETTEGPAIGTPEKFDFSPSEDISRTQVSDALGTEFMGQLKERFSKDAGKMRDAELLAGRFDTDQRVTGLKDLYQQRMDEKKRLAEDPQAQYKRRKANIFAARGPKGQAYRQNVLDDQNKDLNLINQSIDDFVSINNTELNLLKQVDERAAKLYETTLTDVASSMQAFSEIAQADLTAYQTQATNDQQRLKDEANARLMEKQNINYQRANEIATRSNNVQELRMLQETIKEIMREDLERVEKILDADERKAERERVTVENAKMYTSLLNGILNRLLELNNIDRTDNPEPDYSSAETDAFTKIMNQ